MKSVIRDMAIYLLLGMGCIIVASEVSFTPIWHDALLIIGGVLLGGFCVMVTLAKIKRQSQKDLNHTREYQQSQRRIGKNKMNKWLLISIGTLGSTVLLGTFYPKGTFLLTDILVYFGVTLTLSFTMIGLFRNIKITQQEESKPRN